MNITSPLEIKVTQANSSKINYVDFNHLVFGKTFTDHMFECDFVDGAWQNPTIRPYGPLEMMPAAGSSLYSFVRLIPIRPDAYYSQCSVHSRVLLASPCHSVWTK